MLISPPHGLLDTIGQALLDMLEVSFINEVVIRATPEFADSIWKAWDARADFAQKCRDLHALANIDEENLDDIVDAVVKQLGLAPRGEQTESTIGYLRLIPGTIRRHFRRPANPRGTTMPPGLPLRDGGDILPFLPGRMPRFQSGDRPWGIGDWELRDLVELEDDSEVWKAVNPRLAARPPVSLRFFTSPAAKRHVMGSTATVLDRLVGLGRLRGVVPLQQIHLYADPPCAQYPYLQAADLTSLVKEWQEAATMIDPIEVNDLICQIAHTLSQLHTLEPPIAHGSLRATNVLLMTDPAGRRRCLLANLGLGEWIGGAASKESSRAPLIANNRSAERLSEDTLQVRNDVYSFGILWYQLLAGDLTLARPGGSSWRRRLVGHGMPIRLVELLESCFDDDPNARPKDCGVVAAAIRDDLAKAGCHVTRS
jgi:Protein tyrosine and serine/threonine kinase